MIRRVLACVLSLYFLTTFSVAGQGGQLPQSLVDSVNYYETLDSFDARYRVIKGYEDSLKKEKLYSQLTTTDSLYAFLPNTGIDSSRYRYYLLFHAQNIRKYLGNYDHALRYYLEAHQHASENKNFDKYCMNIESLIGNIYARRNDYDKAIYYLTLVIPYLKNEKKYGRLSRHCSDIGNVYKWLGQFDKMEEYYIEGISLGLESKEYRGIQGNYAGLVDYQINFISPDHYDHEAIFNNLSKSKKAIVDNPKSDPYKNLRMMNVEELWAQYYSKIDSLDLALKSILNGDLRWALFGAIVFLLSGIAIILQVINGNIQ